MRETGRLPIRTFGLVMLLGIAFMAFSATGAEAQAGPTDPKENTVSYGQRKAYYDSTLSRPSLRWRCRGIVTLASGSDFEALDVLFARYRRPEKPDDHIRYIIANVTKRYYEIEEITPRLTEFSNSLNMPVDSWYQYNVDLIRSKYGGNAELVEIAKNERLPMLRRATAIYGLERAGKGVLLPMIDELLEKRLPSKPADAGQLLVACAFALRHSASDFLDDDFEKTFETMGKLFDERRITDRTKLAMGRQFARMFKIDQVYSNWDGWRGALMAAQDRQRHGHNEGRTSVRPPGPSFAGVPATGKHIAFVLDLSCSMLQRVNKPKDINPPPPRRNVTGRGSKGEDDDKRPPPRDEDLLDWDKINNRFDLAREYLFLALDRLEPDMSFTVVLFGSTAERMAVTRGLVRATPGNIANVKRVLNAEKIGPRTQHKPLGTLRGDTNIHGGFLRAFEAVNGGAVTRYEYVDEKGYLEGVDTIFLLSDGDPNVDDFVETDIYEEGIRVVHDRESGAAAPKTDNINYQGPYSQPDWLIMDIRRLNMFRQAEIHCIGLGKEANEGLLRRIADVGGGKVRMLGNFD
jgi:hypothetical protein